MTTSEDAGVEVLEGRRPLEPVPAAAPPESVPIASWVSDATGAVLWVLPEEEMDGATYEINIDLYERRQDEAWALVGGGGSDWDWLPGDVPKHDTESGFRTLRFLPDGRHLTLTPWFGPSGAQLRAIVE